VVSLLQPGEQDEVVVLERMGIDVVTELFVPGLHANHRFRSWKRFLLDLRPNYAHVYPIDMLAAQIQRVLPGLQPDVVQLEFLFTAPLQKLMPRLPVVLTEINVVSVNLARQRRHVQSVARRLTSRLDLEKLRRWERKWVRRSTACVAMSEVDAVILRHMAPQTPVYVVPNGVDVSAFARPPGARERKGMVFFGTLGYVPNREAALYFCRNILPRIRARNPDVTLTIIGGRAPDDVVALGSLPGVEYHGFVDDVRPYLWEAAVCVVPLLSGGGTRLKILEALAAGCPVVSTSLGAEGLHLRAGRDLLLADDVDFFAHQVLRILEQKRLAERLSRQGHETTRSRYDWHSITPLLEQVYGDVLDGNTGALHMLQEGDSE
jgi:glycosyltransferase involved in cell wall biosynthesis